MPKCAKPPQAQRHSRASNREHDNDNDSGPEQVTTTTARTRRQPGAGKMTIGRAAQQAETPEQRMLRRMEAAPSDDSDEAASKSLQGAPGSDSDGGSSEMPSDFAVAQVSGMVDSGDSGDSRSRDGDSGASSSSDTDRASGTSALCCCPQCSLLLG